MSEAAPESDPVRLVRQHTTKLPEEVIGRLDVLADSLGFHASNSLSAVILTAFSDVPAYHVWEALAAVRRYRRQAAAKGTPKGGRRA